MKKKIRDAFYLVRIRHCSNSTTPCNPSASSNISTFSLPLLLPSSSGPIIEFHQKKQEFIRKKRGRGPHSTPKNHFSPARFPSYQTSFNYSKFPLKAYNYFKRLGTSYWCSRKRIHSPFPKWKRLDLPIQSRLTLNIGKLKSTNPKAHFHLYIKTIPPHHPIQASPNSTTRLHTALSCNKV